jgi:hypothetical protein
MRPKDLVKTHVSPFLRKQRLDPLRPRSENRHSSQREVGMAWKDFEIEDIVPFGVETGEPVRFSGMVHPVASDLTIAEATRSRINAFGIEYEGKTGLSTSEFSWAACARDRVS